MKVLKMIVAACAALTMTFTAQAAKTAKAVVADSGATLKFVYDEASYGTKGTDWFSVADAEAVEPGYNTPWFNLHNAVTKVLFDGSFAGYRVRHCGAWFTSFGQLATVEGLKNLDVSEATSLTMMFGRCESLTSLDLSAFDTSKVTDMSYMFHGCKKLEQILVSDAFTTDAVATSSYMFYNCTALKGGAGTAYDSTKIDKTYARIDGKEGQPGYFTEKTAKVVVEDGGKTLRFVYDGTNYGTKGTDWFSVAEAEAIDPYAEDVPWYGKREKVTKVVFDASFKDYQSTQCGSWFYKFENLATIVDIVNLDTSAATSFAYMFSNCSALTSLDVTGFDTSKVTNMGGMFAGCSKLASLDVTGFDTSKVTSMIGMFNGCSSLTSLDVTGFDTSAATSFAYMFNGCSSLTSLDVTGFDTSAATRFHYMFYGCSSLTSLDVTGFDTSKVTDMYHMFSGCSSLSTITASDKFVTTAVTRSGSMFAGCTSLKGGNGTAYDSTKTDATYARIDGQDGQPGYFSPPPTVAKVVVEDGGATLRFVYDNKFHGTKGTDWFSVAEAEAIDPYAEDVPWYGKREKVTKVVFDPSFADYRPTQCGNWFYGFEKLETIENIANLNTSEVTSMYSMFWDCSSLTSLDVTGFDTSKVTDMGGMFCACSSLTSLDVTGFDTANVTDMNDMFYGCSSLKTIFASDKFVTTAVTDSGRMFYNCTSLNGGAGTAYNSTNTDKTYARIDGQDGQPGYFTTTLQTVTFNANGGVCGEATRQVMDNAAVGTLPTATRAGYTFDGWFTAASGGTPVTAATVVTAAVAYYAHWTLVYVIPSLFDAVATGGLNPKGATYNGFLGEEALGGTFTLVVKKPKKGQSEGKATLTKLDPVTGKKVKTTGTVDVLTGEGRGALAGLVLGAKGLTGTFEGFRAQGAVDAAKAKDVQTLAVMNAFDKKLYSLVYETPAGDLAMLTATFAKKGKVKIAGTVGDAKVSGSTLLNVGDRCAAPFVWTKKGKSVSFVLWFDKSTKRLIDVSGMGAGVAVVAAGSAEAPANGSYQVKMATADVHASVATAIAGTPYATAAVFDGKKFNAGKSAKVALDKASGAVTIDTAKGANVSGLALKYAKGTLTGSFTVYAVTGGKLAKNKFKIAGVVVDGVGYATATNKKLRAIPVVLAK